MKKALPQSSILNLEDYQLWPAPGHLLSLQGLPLLSKEPFIHPSGRRLRHGFHDTKCSLTRERPLHTAYAAGLSTKLSNIHSGAGNFILSRKEPSLWDNRVVHTGLPFGEQVFTHCNLSYSSQSSRIARDTCSPRPGLRSYFRSSVCSGHPMGMVNDKWHDSPHRSCQPQQWEWDSSRRFVTRGS